MPPPDGAVGSLEGIGALPPDGDIEPELPPIGDEDELPGLVGSSLAQRGSEGDFLHNALSALGDRGFLVGELDCANT